MEEWRNKFWYLNKKKGYLKAVEMNELKRHESM